MHELYIHLLSAGDIEEGQADHDETEPENRSNTITQREFAAFHLFPRQGGADYLFKCNRLFQEYVCDEFARMELSRLQWVRHHQKELRADVYSGVAVRCVPPLSLLSKSVMCLRGCAWACFCITCSLPSPAGILQCRHHTWWVQNALAQGHADAATRGTFIVLPSSFIGGERHMQQQFQDAMSIVRHFGSPSIFTTFTCNPTWPEIADNLLSGQTAQDRPDLTVRVFKLKLAEYIRVIRKRGVFGIAVANIYVIEFQKRGLPHAHLLIILRSEDRPRSPADVDRFVSAEIPCPEQYPAAHACVAKHMIHGPCGALNPNAPCMVNGRCSKGYPKAFVLETIMSENGQPKYRRRVSTELLCSYFPADLACFTTALCKAFSCMGLSMTSASKLCVLMFWMKQA